MARRSGRHKVKREAGNGIGPQPRAKKQDVDFKDSDDARVDHASEVDVLQDGAKVKEDDAKKQEVICENVINAREKEITDAELLTCSVSDLRRALYRPEYGTRFMYHGLSSMVRPSLGYVSLLKDLDEEQHRAFVTYAAPLLYKICGITTVPPAHAHLVSRNGNENGPVFVTGPNLETQHCLIDAITYLVEAWGKPKCVQLTAPTTLAADNIGGDVLRNALRLPFGFERGAAKIRPQSSIWKEYWNDVLGIIVCDFGMVHSTALGAMLIQMRRLREVPNTSMWAGVSFLFVGDMITLGPLGGYPLYRPMPTQCECVESGNVAYMAIKKVVYIDNVSQYESDPQWGMELRRARLGQWSPYLRQTLAASRSPRPKTAVRVRNPRTTTTPSPDRAKLYVLLSRASTHYDVLLTDKISDKDYAYFTPPERAIQEDERLRQASISWEMAYDS